MAEPTLTPVQARILSVLPPGPGLWGYSVAALVEELGYSATTIRRALWTLYDANLVHALQPPAYKRGDGKTASTLIWFAGSFNGALPNMPRHLIQRRHTAP